jgi:hypothetical protein
MIVRRLVTLAMWALWAVIGAAAGLELSLWADRQRDKMQPRAITGALLDKVNQTLERNRA